MELATKEQAEKYISEGRNFVNTTKAPFSDAKSVVRVGIGEYLANKDGLTLYHSVANIGKENED